MLFYLLHCMLVRYGTFIIAKLLHLSRTDRWYPKKYPNINVTCRNETAPNTNQHQETIGRLWLSFVDGKNQIIKTSVHSNA